MTDPISLEDRDVAPFDHARAEAAVRELLHAIGEDPDREGLSDTPARVARVRATGTRWLIPSARAWGPRTRSAAATARGAPTTA